MNLRKEVNKSLLVAQAAHTILLPSGAKGGVVCRNIQASKIDCGSDPNGPRTCAFDILLSLAFGNTVTPREAMAALHTTAAELPDAQRLDRVARIRARNDALRAAAAELGTDCGGAWALAGRLQAAVVRFETRIWPKLKAGMSYDLAPSEGALYRAFLTGAKVPRTQRRLYDLLALC